MNYAFSMMAAGLMMVAAPSIATAATVIGDGTVGSASLYTPVVDLAAMPATFSASFGNTFQVFGTGAFAGVGGLTGYQNGTLRFSSAANTTIDQAVADFFVFGDGRGGTYNFSVSSVTTRDYAATPGVSSSIALLLLGTTANANLDNLATPTSLTLTFNSTGGSPYTASSTLSVPPVTAVPEPATWAMTLIGFGALGYAMRRRPRARVRFA